MNIFFILLVNGKSNIIIKKGKFFMNCFKCPYPNFNLKINNNINKLSLLVIVGDDDCHGVAKSNFPKAMVGKI